MTKKKESPKLRRPEQDLWTERYRPQTLEDLLVPQRVKRRLENGIDNHLIFQGQAGTGKTSAAHILAGDHTYKYINASLNTGIEDVRTKIVTFVEQMSLDDAGNRSGMKVVILDEIDGVSDAFMKALRGVIEGYSNRARFIATCNHFENIPTPIRSRMSEIDFNWSEEEEEEVKRNFAIRIYHICDEEGMEIEGDALLKLIEDRFPDLRDMINFLQGLYTSGVTSITEEHLSNYHGAFIDLYEIIFDGQIDPVENYKKLSRYKNKVEPAIEALGRDFIEYINMNRPNSKDKIGEVIDEVNEHSWQRHFSIDPFVTFLDLVIKLQNIVSK